ncbi:MAG: hypothetical protein J6T10_10680 [Methanobrevibacter sp.]|nr:hypothetical protein [Methanobrevibacter sp.]
MKKRINLKTKKLTDFQISLLKMKADLKRKEAHEAIQRYDSLSDEVSMGELLEAQRDKKKALIFLVKKR